MKTLKYVLNEALTGLVITLPFAVLFICGMFGA